jgi:hypothetical protein
LSSSPTLSTQAAKCYLIQILIDSGEQRERGNHALYSGLYSSSYFLEARKFLVSSEKEFKVNTEET